MKVHIVFVCFFIIIDVLKMSKTYYPQVFLEECKCNVKESNINKFINDVLELDFSDKCNYSNVKENVLLK